MLSRRDLVQPNSPPLQHKLTGRGSHTTVHFGFAQCKLWGGGFDRLNHRTVHFGFAQCKPSGSHPPDRTGRYTAVSAYGGWSNFLIKREHSLVPSFLPAFQRNSCTRNRTLGYCPTSFSCPAPCIGVFVVNSRTNQIFPLLADSFSACINTNHLLAITYGQPAS